MLYWSFVPNNFTKKNKTSFFWNSILLLPISSSKHEKYSLSQLNTWLFIVQYDCSMNMDLMIKMYLFLKIKFYMTKLKYDFIVNNNHFCNQLLIIIINCCLWRIQRLIFSFDLVVYAYQWVDNMIQWGHFLRYDMSGFCVIVS